MRGSHKKNLYLGSGRLRTPAINETDRGWRVYNKARSDKPNIGEYGTMFVPPYKVKTDTLRTCAYIWIVETT